MGSVVRKMSADECAVTLPRFCDGDDVMHTQVKGNVMLGKLVLSQHLGIKSGNGEVMWWLCLARYLCCGP